MFNKKISEKSKIITLKDIVSLLIIFTIIGVSVCSVWGSPAISRVVRPQNKPVSARNLAMFASIAYADIEKIAGYDIPMNSNLNDKAKINQFNRIKKLTFKEVPMVTDDQLSKIKSSAVLLGIDLSGEEEDTYSYLFYGLASTNEVADWKLVNYSKFNTTVYKGNAQFTAMTFKRGNDIVIAYRGTDFDDIGDWLQDICYGTIGYAGQELVAQDYARLVAEHYAKNNNNVKIYITGHSLGGYLAQIGGGVLAGDNNYSDNLKEVSYFNGMGLQFWANTVSSLTASLRNKYNINTDEYKQLKDINSNLNKIQISTRDSLKNWKNKGGKLVSYQINGDLISALGVHPGDRVGFDAHNISINHHGGNQASTDFWDNVKNKISQSIGTTLFNTVNKTLKTFNTDLTEYIKKYGATNPLKFVWITHETDGFFAVLPLDNGLPIPKIEAAFTKVPSKIKINKTDKATLVINTVGGKLQRDKLTANDFTISHTSRLKINSVSAPQIVKTDVGYKYTYTITLKAKAIVGNSVLMLKPNILKLNIDNELRSTKFAETSNNQLVTGAIKTSLTK